MVIALFAALIGPWFVNWNDYKATFEEEAEKIVGRPVHVVGSASATLLPSPSLTFDDVTIGDAGREPMMTVQRFEITIELMPLLQGKFRITSMRLDHPQMNVVVNEAGKLDWQARSEASKALDPENVILDRLEIADGRIDYSDAVGETDLTFEGINAVIEARSLLGPWRIEGSYLDGGDAVPFRFATGRRLDDGTIRVKTDFSPAGWPVALAADGIVGSDDDGLYYDGTYNLTQIVVATPSADEAGDAGGATGWRSVGKFRLTRRQLAISQALLSEGPVERPSSVAGSLTVDLGGKPRFEAHASARQIDLDRSLGKGPTEPVEVSSAAASLVTWLQDSFVPPIRGSLFFKVPAIVVGGSVIQDVAFEAHPTIGGWRITSFNATLPGRAALEARGVVSTDFEVGFAGNFRLVVNQPALFATWWRGESQGGGRLLAPFEITARAELSPAQFNFEEVDAVFGEAGVRGRFVWSEETARQHQRVLEAELVADSIDSVQVRAFLELVGGEDFANRTVLADSYDLKLSADTLLFEDVVMRDVAIDASYADDTLTVDEFSVGDLGGAHVNVTQGRIESLSGQPQGRLDAQVEAETLDALTRVVGNLLPNHPFSQWLRDAAPSLAPAFLAASIEAPAEQGGADVRVTLSGRAASTTLSAALDATGGVAGWRAGEARVKISVDTNNAAELARQAGLTLGNNENPGGARLEIIASGVPADGMETQVDGEFAGIDLRTEGRLQFARDGPPTYAGSLAAVSDDAEPLLRMLGLGIPVAALGNAVRIEGALDTVGSAAELRISNSQVADRLVDGHLSLAKTGETAWTVGGDLHVDAVDLDWITAIGLGFALEPTGEPGAPWSRAPFGELGFGGVSGKITVSSDTFAIMDGFDVTAATLTFDMLPNRLAVDLAGGQAVGGTMSGGLSIHNVGGNVRLTGRFDLNSAVLEQMVWWRGDRAAATGVVDLSAEFEAAGRSPAVLASSLTGGGAVAVRDGEVRYMNPQAARLVIRASDLGQEFTENELREAFTRQIDGGSFAFDHAEGAFAIAAGVARLKSVSVEGADMDATGDAVIDLTKLTIDSDWTVTFDPGDDRVEGAVPQVGIVFRGPLSAPDRIIDVLQFGSYLNIRQEERLLELLSQAEADRLEANRLNREKRKIREDAERRARKAAEAEAKRIAADAEARRLAAEAAARRTADEAARVAAEAQARRAAAEAAARDVVEALSVHDAAVQEAKRLAAVVDRHRRTADDAAAKATAEAAALSKAEAAMRDAAATEAERRSAAQQAAQAAAAAGRQHAAAAEAIRAARDAQTALDDAKAAAESRAAEAVRRQRDAEAAAAAASDELAARSASEREAQQLALDAEQRKKAAEAAAGLAADKVQKLAVAEADARQRADEAARISVEAGERLSAARQAVETAKAEVAQLEAARAKATEESDRILATANERLRDAVQNSESPPAETVPGQEAGVTEEEADRLRAEVRRAIQAADEAGRALADAQTRLTSTEEEVALREAEFERLRAAAAQASGRAAEAAAGLGAAEQGAQTAKANAEALRGTAEDASRNVEAAAAARVAAETQATRLRAEAERLAGTAEATAARVAGAESAQTASAADTARLEDEAERLKRAADEAAAKAADENATLQAAAQEAARLADEAARQRRVAEEAAAAADAARAILEAAIDAAGRAAAEAERFRLAVEAVERAADEAKTAVKTAEANAARVAAKAEEQRLVAEEATRKALEVSVPQ